VRTPAEWKHTGIIRGSIRITYMDNEGRVDKKAFLKMVKEKTTSKDDLIVLVCRTGVRSKKAAQWLAKEGYTNIYNKTHGIKECLRYNRDKLTKDFY
jgi:rhodanese-related sulfurtransferase